MIDKNKLNLVVFDLVNMGFSKRSEIQKCFGYTKDEMDYIMEQLKNK